MSALFLRLRFARRIAMPAAAALLALPLSAHAAFEKRLTVDAGSLQLLDLIGEVRVESGTGTAYEILVRVDGRDATEERVTVEQKTGDPARVLVRFPTDKEHDFVYPKLGHGSNTNFSLSSLTGEDHDLLGMLLRGGQEQIHVRGSGKGLELWADVTIRVPAGKTTTIRLGCGSIEAAGTTGDLTLDTVSGSIAVSDVKGAVTLDTGSGSVSATGVKGRMSADTGSGNVQIESCAGEKVVIDTGSGNVAVDGLEASDLRVDTGSGNVHATGLGSDSMLIDTGSGNVRVAISRLGTGRFRVDTGSGAVELALPADASATVHADTGSGSIRYESADENLRAEDHLDFRILQGGAEIELDTGSGPITIRQ